MTSHEGKGIMVRVIMHYHDGSLHTQVIPSRNIFGFGGGCDVASLAADNYNQLYKNIVYESCVQLCCCLAQFLWRESLAMAFEKV